MAWFLFALIAITYIINELTLKYGFHNLNYKLETSKRTYEIGEEIEVTTIIENNKILMLSFLTVEEVLSEGFNIEKSEYTLFIRPFQRVKRTYKLYGMKRGLRNIKEVNLLVGDFIGFNEKIKNIRLFKDIIIFPEKIELQDNITFIGDLNGDVSVKRWIIEDPLMTIGIREYTGYEPQRHIHWPSSARYNNLMVKNFDFTTENSVLIVLNIETMKPSWKIRDTHLVERAICLSGAVMEELEEQKIPYGFITNGHNIGKKKARDYSFYPSLGKNHLHNLLEILGSMNYSVAVGFEEMLQGIRKTKGNYKAVLFITPKILESYIEPLNLVSKTLERTILISVDREGLDNIDKNIIRYRGD